MIFRLKATSGCFTNKQLLNDFDVELINEREFDQKAFVEINSLENLINFVQACKHEVVISAPLDNEFRHTLEIYDDYRE